MIALIHHPEGSKRLGDLLVENLSNSEWRVFRAAVAFVKQSGTKHLVAPLKKFLINGDVRLSVGIDLGGTSFEGLQELHEAVGKRGEAYVFHNRARSTFHPKIFLFVNERAAEAFVGSGNLTEGGLFTNYEAFVQLTLDRLDATDSSLLASLEQILDEWSNPSSGAVRKLTNELLGQLKDSGELPTEAEIRDVTRKNRIPPKKSSAPDEIDKLFAALPVKPAPRVATPKQPVATRQVQDETGLAPHAGRGFVMTLQRTDVGVGQVTRGSAKRSPEIFIPLVARDRAPDFWGWKSLFKRDKAKPGKWDRVGVRMRLGREIIAVNMMTWPDKHDFRLRNASLRDAGKVGDVLRIEKGDAKTGYDYYVEIVPQGSSDYPRYLALCDKTVRNSKKQWGYY